MTRSSSAIASRNRQIAYALGILLLFTAMYPYTEWLNRVKNRRELGEATIGQIDTGSIMLKLALIGGMRGLAANYLWTRANELQRLHEWHQMDQTINLITKLQPHFLSVWTFQSWNLAYNVSVEWDDAADKYRWIKEGILFVRDGVEKNRNTPDLLWDTAWYYYHKLGFSDESILLRRLFYDDDDEDFKLDALRYETEGIRTTFNDSFRVSRGWYQRSINKADEKGRGYVGGLTEAAPDASLTYIDQPVQRKGRLGDLHFRTGPATAQTRYAMALEKQSIKGIEPKFGDFAREAWTEALDEWLTFGRFVFPAHESPGVFVQIEDSMDPKKMSSLVDAGQYWTDRWSNDTHYRYWRDRADAERERQAVDCRRYFYEATVALKAADFETAADKYLRGLTSWEDLMQRHPFFRDDELNKQDTGFLVKRYALAKRQLDLGELPEDTPFYDLYLQVKDEQIPTDPHDALEVLGRDASSSPALQ